MPACIIGIFFVLYSLNQSLAFGNTNLKYPLFSVLVSYHQKRRIVNQETKFVNILATFHCNYYYILKVFMDLALNTCPVNSDLCLTSLQGGLVHLAVSKILRHHLFVRPVEPRKTFLKESFVMVWRMI